ncbi:MAG: MBL fold metallo-hydrolase [Deltaproteobacteria bacterium]|nr:MBL fold metallo-hydrolase [Deltaproteobacteria bacterium]
MRIRFWGVRGSIATSGPEFARFGGNTTCFEIEAGDQRLIIDAGTGLRRLGDKLSAQARLVGRDVQATMLFTHLHWDHIQGFPFFAPAYLPGTELDLYGPLEQDGVTTLEDVLATQMTPPTFPVGLGSMSSTKRFHVIGDGDTLELGDLVVRARSLSHPQGSLGYRVDYRGRSLCFATDTEHPDNGAVDEALADLARGVDLFICDAQYTEAEYEGRVAGPPRKGWGHSTYVAAARTAKAAGAKRLMLTHHDPNHDDGVVAAIEREARVLFPACRAAAETRPLTV